MAGKRIVRSAVLMAAIAVAILGYVAWSATAIRSDRSVPVNSYARPLMNIATAISKLKYGSPGSGSLSVVIETLVQEGFNSRTVNEPDALDRAIAKSLHLQIDPNPEMFSSNANEVDDQGYAQFIMVAFTVFGFHMRSLFLMAMCFLTISVGLYFLAFRNTPPLLLISICYLAGVAVAMEVMPDSTVASVIQDARFASLWSGPAALHLAFLLVRPRPLSFVQWAAAAFQGVLVVFAVAVRSASAWQLLFLLTLGGCMLVRCWSDRRVRYRSAVLAALLVGLIVINSLQSRISNGQAFFASNTGRHLVWHSLAMGLAFHPRAAGTGLGTRDWEIYNLADHYLDLHPEAARELHINPTVIRRSEGYADFGPVGWGLYDAVVELAVKDFVWRHLDYVLETVLYYRPLYVAEQLAWQFGLRKNFPDWITIDPVHVPGKALRVQLFSIPGLAVVLAAFAAGYAWRRGRPRNLPGLGVMALFCLFSTLPMLAFVPFYQELPVVTTSAAGFAYMIGGSVLLAAADIAKGGRP